MPQLDTVVDISIDAQTTSPAQTGFGKPLFVGFHNKFVERAREYSSLQGMLADGFATTDSLYKMAKAAFAQNPRPPVVLIGRLTTPSTQTVTLVPVAVNLKQYALIINGVTVTFTADGTALAAEIVAGFVTAINASAVATAVTASGTTTLSIVADVPGTQFTVEVPPTDLDLWTFQNVTTDGSGIAAQLAAISLENDSWYALAMDSSGKAEILAAAAYIETVRKIFIAQTNDSDVQVTGSGDVASALLALNYKRTALMFVRQFVQQYAAAAWLGRMLPTAPGSATWKFKALSGVTPDSYSDAQFGFVRNKRANYYTAIVPGTPTTGEGVLSSGEFIDVTVFLDWLRARMQERIYSLLVNSQKIPLTDGGISKVEAQVRGQLLEGVSAGGLDGNSLQVIVPRAAAISAADRAARKLTGISFQARLSGAVHSVVVTGTITV
jgi:hypothetical protein